MYGLKVIALSLMFSLSLFASDTEISLDIFEPEYKTFNISEEQIEHLLVAFRRCTKDDQCLRTFQQIVLEEDTQGTLAIEKLSKEDCFETLFYKIAIPFLLSCMCEASGYLFGGLYYQKYTSAIGSQAAGAILFWCLAAVFYYLFIPVKHNREKEAIKADIQKLLQPDKIINTLARINEVRINDIKVLSISRNYHDHSYTVNISSSIMDSLRKLDIFSIVFPQAQVSNI